MSVTGSGVGGNVGGPQEPLQRERETTAATEVVKQMWAIVKDTIEIPFTQIGGNPWKYQASANRPNLAPLASTRVLVGYEPPQDFSWKGLAEDLANLLPEDFKKRYQAQMQLPFEERDLEFVALDNLLNASAKVIQALTIASQPVIPDSQEDYNSQVNLVMPYLALTNVVSQGNIVISQAQSFLEELGANHPNFDHYSNFTSLLSEVQKDLSIIQGIVKDGQSKPSTEDINHVSAEITDLNAQMNRYEVGNDFQILQNTLEAMATSVATLPFLGTGAASLILGLNTAMYGAKASNNTSGFIGNSLGITLDAALNGLFDHAIPETSLGGKNLLGSIALLTFIGIYCFSNSVSNTGIGIFPERDLNELISARNFQYDLFLHLVASTHVLNAFFTNVASQAGVGNNQAHLVGQIFGMSSLLMMILAGSKGNQENTIRSLDSLKSYFKGGVDLVGNLVSEKLLNGELDSEVASGLGVALQQARISLNNDDSEGMLSAFSASLNLLGITNEDFSKDLKNLNQLSSQYQDSFTGGIDDKTNKMTTITQYA